MQLQQAGIRKQEVEAGTAYHIPEGVVAVYQPRIAKAELNQTRARVNADQLKDWMLRISRDGYVAIKSLDAV
jgi:hypothetical protein